MAQPQGGGFATGPGCGPAHRRPCPQTAAPSPPRCTARGGPPPPHRTRLQCEGEASAQPNLHGRHTPARPSRLSARYASAIARGPGTTPASRSTTNSPHTRMQSPAERLGRRVSVCEQRGSFPMGSAVAAAVLRQLRRTSRADTCQLFGERVGIPSRNSRWESRRPPAAASFTTTITGQGPCWEWASGPWPAGSVTPSSRTVSVGEGAFDPEGKFDLQCIPERWGLSLVWGPILDSGTVFQKQFGCAHLRC